LPVSGFQTEATRASVDLHKTIIILIEDSMRLPCSGNDRCKSVGHTGYITS